MGGSTSMTTPFQQPQCSLVPNHRTNLALITVQWLYAHILDMVLNSFWASGVTFSPIFCISPCLWITWASCLLFTLSRSIWGSSVVIPSWGGFTIFISDTKERFIKCSPSWPSTSDSKYNRFSVMEMHFYTEKSLKRDIISGYEEPMSWKTRHWQPHLLWSPAPDKLCKTLHCRLEERGWVV